MSAKLFVWVGHPRKDSLSHGLADAFERGAGTQNAEIRRMNLHDMEFDTDRFDGYGRKDALEPALWDWRDAVDWCDHMVWIHPYWWGGMPARMKAVVERALTPGFGFKYRGPDSLAWDKLLTGKTADVIITSDTPPWYDTLKNGSPGRKVAKNQVLGFCGVKTINAIQVGPVKIATDKQIANWLAKAYDLGAEAGRR